MVNLRSNPSAILASPPLLPHDPCADLLPELRGQVSGVALVSKRAQYPEPFSVVDPSVLNPYHVPTHPARSLLKHLPVLLLPGLLDSPALLIKPRFVHEPRSLRRSPALVSLPAPGRVTNVSVHNRLDVPRADPRKSLFVRHLISLSRCIKFHAPHSGLFSRRALQRPWPVRSASNHRLDPYSGHRRSPCGRGRRGCRPSPDCIPPSLRHPRSLPHPEPRVVLRPRLAPADVRPPLQRPAAILGEGGRVQVQPKFLRHPILPLQDEDGLAHGLTLCSTSFFPQ